MTAIGSRFPAASLGREVNIVTTRTNDAFDGWLGHTWRLSEMELFADLATEDLDRIAMAAPMRQVARGSLVYGPVGGSDVLFILKRGRVRLFRSTADGRTLTTAIVTPGQLFGQMPLLGQRMGDSMAEMLDAGVVCQLNSDDVQRLLLADPRVAARIAAALGQRIAELEQRLSDTALKSVPERVAAALVTLAGDPPTTIRLTHEQLADLVGTTRETSTKVLGEFRDRRLIALRRGRIDLIDVIRLRSIAGIAETREPK